MCACDGLESTANTVLVVTARYALTDMKHLLKQGLDLAAAVSGAEKHTAADLTVAELVRGYNVAANSDFDWRLRKWVEAFGNLSAWELSSETIEIAAAAMLKAGYKPSTIDLRVWLGCALAEAIHSCGKSHLSTPCA